MLKILVVDYSDSVRELLSAVLSSSGDIVVHEARNGAEALHQMGVKRTDLVFLACSLEDMTCEELVAEMGKLSAVVRPPICFLGESADRYRVEHLISRGIDGFVTKPIDVRDLLKNIAILLPSQSLSSDQTDPPKPQSTDDGSEVA